MTYVCENLHRSSRDIYLAEISVGGDTGVPVPIVFVHNKIDGISTYTGFREITIYIFLYKKDNK